MARRSRHLAPNINSTAPNILIPEFPFEYAQILVLEKRERGMILRRSAIRLQKFAQIL